MTSTNRMANRLLLILTGLAFVLVGGYGLARPFLPAPSRLPSMPVVTAIVERMVAGATSAVGPLLGVAAGCLLGIAVLIAFIAAQGRGATTLLVDTRSERDGGTVLELGVARSLLRQEFDRRKAFVRTHVSAYRVRGVVMLRCTVEPRRGTDPSVSATVTTGALVALGDSLGRSLPAMVLISSGLHARFARRSRAVAFTSAPARATVERTTRSGQPALPAVLHPARAQTMTNSPDLAALRTPALEGAGRGVPS